MRKMIRTTRTQPGFTLIELLLIIIILGILAAIVVVAIGSTRGDAERATCSTGARAIEESAVAVEAKTDAFPVGTFDASSPANPLLVPEAGALLKTWPEGTTYVLRYDSGDPSSYAVKVYRADGTTLVVSCGAL